MDKNPASDPFFALSVIQGAFITDDGLEQLEITSNFSREVEILLTKEGILTTGRIQVPEPTTYALCGGGLMFFLALLRRRQKTKTTTATAKAKAAK
jgi:hypothetical protein